MASEARTVLVVDDDRDLLMLLAQVLEEAGYRVVTAVNGLAALQVLERGLPDLILCDMMMPVMDGKDFAREFHAKYGNGTPLVVCTASMNPRRVASEVGAVEAVDKTLDLDAVVEAVGRHIPKG